VKEKKKEALNKAVGLAELRQPEAHILLPDAHLPLYERVS